MIVSVAVFLLSAFIAETRSTKTTTATTTTTITTLSKDSLIRTRRAVTGLRTQCIPYLKNFCQWFTVRGVTKRFCIAKTLFMCTSLD